MERNTVTVIVPVYNAGPYLRQALNSIVSQTHRELEILLINDGSTDSSLETMREYEAADERVRVIDKPNEGYGATCNRGIDEAQGYWVAIVEPDDWIDARMYADMVNYASRFECIVDVVKTPYWRVIDPDTADQQIINCSYRALVRPKAQPFSLEEAPHLIAHHPSIWSALYRKGYLDERGIRFEPIPGAGWADNPFLVETLCQTDRIVYLDRPYYFYREETEAKTRATAENNTLLPLERWMDMTDIMEGLGVDAPGVWQAHYERGLTYLDGICAYVPLDRDDVLEGAIKMFDRMDPAIVFGNPNVSPYYKQLFALVEGIEPPAFSALPYAFALTRKGFYFLHNAGPAYTWKMAKRILGSAETSLHRIA